MKDSLIYEFKKGKIAKSRDSVLEAASIIKSFLTVYTRHQTHHIGEKKRVPSTKVIKTGRF